MPSDPESYRRGPHQLPPGRHGLSRRFVQANQRERILEAVADAVSLAGYAATSVEDIVGAAGVSRRTFYDNFNSKEDAFLAALDAVGAELVARVEAAYNASDTFAGGVLACLGTILDFLAAKPHYADTCLVEVLAASTAAVERRNTLVKTFAGLLHAGAQTVPGGIRPPQLIAETIVGGVYEVVYSRVGRTRELPDLLPDLAYSVMSPYLGPRGHRARHQPCERGRSRLTAGGAPARTGKRRPPPHSSLPRGSRASADLSRAI